MMSWHGHRALVTGATGMVGSSLVGRLIAEGCQVVALIRDADPQSELFRSALCDSVSVVNGRLEDYATIERAINEHETDTVFHLGAQTIVGTAFRSPLATFEANIRGTYNLLDACRRLDGLVRAVVVASSDKAYGDCDVLPYTETTPLQGRHPYDVSKSCADLLSMAYAHTYAVPVNVARCGNIYGAGDLNWSRIVPGTIRSAHWNERPILRSDGTPLRDYLFVEDIVEAYLLIAQATHEGAVKGDAFNFGTTTPISSLDVMRVVLRAAGAEHLEPIVANTMRAEIIDQHLDSTKARQELCWEPKHDLENGLALTVEWYKRFFRDYPGSVA